ncbi:MAG: lysophospholipase [Ignavibacteriaceae bacterium]|jgi:pimeloyl-ACP methyl ester carboxylesterase|nr:lysophospholipase [Ignavibacteriaceae bacterium]MCW8813862.1 lysophospholipase [Chlorobium sp.]MCW8995336.1 lysophospholipase [Psychromonas sp.]MCW8818477.1 lysophospholipase [Ignavibacteriaceae bacterium]MCW9095041.1 lysophospholipase [Ignavibacteriaceae bacterium]
MQLEVITREPESDAHNTPVLFVHGMWHAAWCWSENFLPYFAQHGYKSYAMSLRGHGASDGREKLRWTPLADFVADVAQVVDQLENPPILVGHSMGGMIIQKYLETLQAPAAVMLGSAPPKGLLPTTLRIARRHPLNFLKANLTFNLNHNINKPELYKEALFSSKIDDKDLTKYFNIVRFQGESMRAYIDMIFLNLPQPKKVNTPILVLGATDDNLISSSDVRATAKAYNTQAEFFPIMGHAMMLDIGWQSVADQILNWLKEQGL